MREIQRTFVRSSHQAPFLFPLTSFHAAPQLTKCVGLGTLSGPSWCVDRVTVLFSWARKCRGSQQWTSMSFRGNNNISTSEAGIALMVYA